MSETNDICAHCGAPRAPGHGACTFCGTVFARAQQTSTQENVVPCPQCRTVNEWGAQKCVKCQAWVVVQCLFCSSLSPHHVPACLRCHEAFAGAPERFAQRQAAQQGQHRMQVMGTVGNVAASFLGAAVGGAFSGGGYRHEGHHSHHSHHNSSYDNNDGYNRNSNSDGGIFSAFTGDNSDSGQSNVDPSNSGGSGGGLMDSLFGGDSSSSDNNSSSDGSSSDTGDAGGGGGGLMDDLFGGSSSSDDS
jgi:phage FluMu protein Com